MGEIATWRGGRKEASSLVLGWKHNIFIISYRLYIQTYTHRRLPLCHPPHRTTMALSTHSTSRNNNEALFMAKISFSLLLFPPESECYAAGEVCVRGWAYVHVGEGSSWVQLFFLGISSACYVRRNKNLWKRWKHHPIFCVYGTFRKTSSPFHGASCLSHADFNSSFKKFIQFYCVYVFYLGSHK